MNSSIDTNLRLGDIREYDCTLGYRPPGVTVQWKEYESGTIWNINPLILTANQSINNTVYACHIKITYNPDNCPVQQANVSITVKGTIKIHHFTMI